MEWKDSQGILPPNWDLPTGIEIWAHLTARVAQGDEDGDEEAVFRNNKRITARLDLGRPGGCGRYTPDRHRCGSDGVL